MSAAKLKTLRDIIQEHPEWLDIPIGIYTESGEYDYVGARGFVYEGEGEDGKPVVVFSAN